MSGSLAGVLRACAGLLGLRMRFVRHCSSTRDRLPRAASALQKDRACSAPSVLILDSMELPSGAAWRGGCQIPSQSGDAAGELSKATCLCCKQVMLCFGVLLAILCCVRKLYDMFTCIMCMGIISCL